MSTKTIGILTPNMDGQYFGGLVYHLHQEVRRRGMRMILLTTLKNDSSYHIPLAAHTVDGWITVKHPINPNVYAHMRDAGRPVVGLGLQRDDYPCIYVNDFRLMETAVRHLASHGHKRIVFIGDLKNPNFRNRLKGYRAVLEQIPGHNGQDWVIDTPNFNDHTMLALKAGEQLLQFAANGCTAAVCCTDYLAVQVIQKLQTESIRVPHDFAVIGVDNSPRHWGNQPELTTIQVPVQQMAEAAVAQLAALMDGKPAYDVTDMDTPLIVHESCGCTLENRMERDLKFTRELFNRLEAANEVGRRIAGLLVSGNMSNLENLSWIENTHLKWGMFAKFIDRDATRLHIVSLAPKTYRPRNFPVGLSVKAEDFPFREILMDDFFDEQPDLVPVMYPIQSPSRNWGVLVLAQQIDLALLHYRAYPITYSFALLGAALERTELFNENRQMTQTLEVVSNMTNDGIWELDLHTRTLTWSQPTQSILGFMLGDDLDSFLQYIHPDDRNDAVQLFNPDNHTQSSMQKIVRVQHAGSSEYIWIEISAKVVEGASGAETRMIGSIRDITERMQYEQQISYMAYHDTLTGLPNRAFFLSRLKDSIACAQENGYRMAVLLIDLDRFKTINDTYGHSMGDLVLRHTAHQLNSVTREGDIVARHGGDEFTMLVPYVKDVSEVYSLCSRIMALFQKPLLYEGKSFQVTGSVGFSLFPDDGDDVDMLINNADTAMYQAKSDGRNRYESYKSDLNVLVRGRLMMEQALHSALANQEFTLVYQPQIDARSGRIVGVEALLRWESPVLGHVSPMEFIPIAEDTGLIRPIGEWVLKEACRQSVYWQRKGIQPLTMSVNISSLQLQENNFVDKVRHVLNETGQSPHHLCLEITESTAIHNMEQCLPKLSALMEMGVQVALDDFGTGYSSLSVLSRLPLQIVKLDKSFTQLLTDEEKGERKSAIVKSIISMAQELELVSLAEGVETEEQLHRLQAFGCDTYQGYWFSRPLPAPQIEAMLDQRLAL